MSAIKLASKLKENLVINPLMDIWQRNTTFNPITNGAYCADRFLVSETLVTGAIRIDRSTDVPTESLATHSLKATVTTAQGVVAAGEYAGIIQRIEGYNIRKIKGRNAVLSFWVKAPIAGEYSVSFSNGAQDRSLIKKYTVNQANTWEKKVIKFKHDSSGTWNYSNGIGLYCWFMLAAGSTFATASEEWQNGLKIGSDGQANVFATLNNEFAITQIQLHEGIDELPFEEIMRDIQTEIELCQRYYEKSYELDTPPATITQVGMSSAFSTGWSSTNEYRTDLSFLTNKRTIPVVNVYNPNTGALNNITDSRFGGNRAAFATLISKKGFSIGNGVTGVTHSGHDAQWAADAEL